MFILRKNKNACREPRMTPYKYLLFRLFCPFTLRFWFFFDRFFWFWSDYLSFVFFFIFFGRYGLWLPVYFCTMPLQISPLHIKTRRPSSMICVYTLFPDSCSNDSCLTCDIYSSPIFYNYNRISVCTRRFS